MVDLCQTTPLALRSCQMADTCAASRYGKRSAQKQKPLIPCEISG
jgi:hypothetical protein